MRVLVACERVDAEGGTETYLRSLLPALVSAGYEVRVVARFVTTPDLYGVPAQMVEWSDEHDAPSADAAACVAAIAREFRPDVAALHNVLDAGIAEAMRRHAPRVVYHVHDHRPFCPNGDRLYPRGGGICTVGMGEFNCGWHSLVNGCVYGPRPRTLALIRRRQSLARAIARTDATIALSRYIANLAQSNGVDAARTQVVAPALGDAAFAQSPAARPRTDAVLFAGRIMPSKGARSLVHAMATIPAPERPLLRIAGAGPDLSATVGEARSLGVRFEALGDLDPAALRRAYDDATLVAMPSLWGEPFGLVGIEAFARGRPVVAYDVGAIPEWLRNGLGFVVPRGEHGALATAIRTLLERPAWGEISARAFAASQAYRMGAHVERIGEIYRQ